MMATDTGAALAAAVAADPDDDGLRLIYADYLEEHGQTMQAANERYRILARTPEARAWAWAVAQAVQRRCVNLVRSRWGAVVWGRGGQAEVSWDKYSKGWHRQHGPARWRNAGVRIVGRVDGRPPEVVVENYRGTEVLRVPLDLSRSPAEASRANKKGGAA